MMLFLLNGVVFTTQNKAQGIPEGDENLVQAKVPSPSLSNNLIGVPSEQKVYICLPPSYLERGKKYPVLYFLTGFGDEAAFYTNGMYQDLKMQGVLKDLTEKKAINEMIIVIASGTNFLGGSFYVNSDVGGNWEDYIVNDLIGYIDKNFRTIPQAEARGIAGHSMGGFGALYIAFRHPELFSAVYALSPQIFDNNGLSNSQMFAQSFVSEKFLKCEKENSELSREKAHERLLIYCDNTRDLDLLFTLAYGMAFAPDTKKNAPYIDFPYSKAPVKANLNKELWNKWEDGIGGWDAKIKSLKENILKLKSIGIEYGLKDENKWIVDGCKYFIKVMNSEKIPLKSLSFAGGHQDNIKERIEKFMFPFFSAAFASK